MNIKKFIENLQSLPTEQRKIILWTIIIILGVTMGFFWIKIAAERIKNIDQDRFVDQLNLAPLGGEIEKIKEQKDFAETQMNQEWKDIKNDPELLEELKKESTPEEWAEIQKELEEYERQENNNNQ